MKTIEELPIEFDGRGKETRGFKFYLIEKLDNWIIYKVDTGDSIHYEVFRRKLAKVCIDFENRIYDDNHLKVIYPKANSFGVWAWSCQSVEKCHSKIKYVESNMRDNENN